MSLKLPNKIKISTILLYFELYLLFPYAALGRIGIVSVLLKYTKPMVLLLEMGFVLINLINHPNQIRTDSKNKRIYGTGLLIVAFAFVQCAITIIRTHNYNLAINTLIPFVLMVFVVMRMQKDKFDELLKAIALFFWFTIFANTMTILVYGQGGMYVEHSLANLHVCFLLGVDNQFGRFLLPGVALIWFYEAYSHSQKKILTYSAMIMVLISYLFLSNGTGSIVVVLFIAMFIAYSSKKVDRYFSFGIFCGVIVVLLLSIFLQRGIMYSDSDTANLIADTTGKSLTFSGRIYIWEEGVRMFKKHPLIGYGKQPNDYMVHYLDYIFSAHNVFLHCLLDSGLVGGFFFSLPFVAAGMLSRAIQKVFREVRILYIGIFVTSVYFMMEVGSLVSMMLMVLIMAVYSAKADNKIYEWLVEHKLWRALKRISLIK